MRKLRNQKGFTLIELLIVVAIIGIIAAIAIPNLINAINRARQKRSMADMRSIGNAVEAYQVDYNQYPKGITDMATLEGHLEPTYIKNLPQNDGWNVGFYFQSDANGVDYSIISYGKNGTSDGVTPGNQTNDFNNDIAFSNGSFVQWPEGVQQ